MPDLLEQFAEVNGKEPSPEARQDECIEIFDRAIMALNEKYVSGTYDYISQNKKELYNELVQIETELHRAWGVDVNTFREVLTRYYKTSVRCIEIYKESLD